MFEFLNTYNSSVLVAIGAAPGAFLRMQISTNFNTFKRSKFLGILFVNSIATFLLGLCLGLQNRAFYLNTNQPLYLMICVGFLGSLSTFSSLILEIFSYFVQRKWIDLTFSLSVSLFFGLLLASLGYHLGNV